jgi:hypothetical protein
MANRWGLWTYSVSAGPFTLPAAIVAAASPEQARELAEGEVPTGFVFMLGVAGPPAGLVSVLGRERELANKEHSGD